MKLRALTNVKNKEKIKKEVKPKKVKRDNNTFNDLHLDLAVTISPNYKGTSDSISGVLNSLPKTLKTLFVNSTIKRAVLRQGYSMFLLDNSFTLFIKEITIKSKLRTNIQIKHNKKYVFSATI